MKLIVTTHYSVDDPECMGDYHFVTVEKAGIFVDKDYVIVQFGDYYHDKGDLKADAFIQGVEWALGITVEREDKRVADSDY